MKYSLEKAARTLNDTGIVHLCDETAVTAAELIEALGASPKPSHGHDRSGLFVSRYTLPDGRFLTIGYGPDEAWLTARIRVDWRGQTAPAPWTPDRDHST